MFEQVTQSLEGAVSIQKSVVSHPEWRCHIFTEAEAEA